MTIYTNLTLYVTAFTCASKNYILMRQNYVLKVVTTSIHTFLDPIKQHNMCRELQQLHYKRFFDFFNLSWPWNCTNLK